MSIEIPQRHKDEDDASLDQKEKLKSIGVSDPKVLSQLGVHQANNILSFVEGTKHVISHFDNSLAGISSNMEVNSQVKAAIVQTNVKVLGEAPAMAMGSLYQTIGHSVAMAAADAVYAQQQANVTYQAASTLGIDELVNEPTT